MIRTECAERSGLDEVADVGTAGITAIIGTVVEGSDGRFDRGNVGFAGLEIGEGKRTAHGGEISPSG